mmetsp:Transcript_141435/g.368385  ORF Transcript_141435/g.368385 Transcript_141435/m.368385 type:complete len:283 (+) Transcript_141435:950-1798(+)
MEAVAAGRRHCHSSSSRPKGGRPNGRLVFGRCRGRPSGHIGCGRLGRGRDHGHIAPEVLLRARSADWAMRDHHAVGYAALLVPPAVVVGYGVHHALPACRCMSQVKARGVASAARQPGILHGLRSGAAQLLVLATPTGLVSRPLVLCPALAVEQLVCRDHRRHGCRGRRGGGGQFQAACVRQRTRRAHGAMFQHLPEGLRTRLCLPTELLRGQVAHVSATCRCLARVGARTLASSRPVVMGLRCGTRCRRPRRRRLCCFRRLVGGLGRLGRLHRGGRLAANV